MATKCSPCDDAIPFWNSLSPVYGEVPAPAVTNTFRALQKRFDEEFGGRACLSSDDGDKGEKGGANLIGFVRAPGRVNLIGEHVDYMGFSVLPMALTKDIVMAVGTAPVREGEKAVVTVANLDEEFPTESFPVDPSHGIDRDGGHRWSHYFQCGYKGCFDSLATTDASGGGKPGQHVQHPVSLRVVVKGTVPRGSGLSSSSAFVVASALATALANDVVDTFTRTSLAETCCRCEWYIGTMGGGMDQSISCLGESGMAKHVQFNPLRASSVRLPPGGIFVISNSLATSAKVRVDWFLF